MGDPEPFVNVIGFLQSHALKTLHSVCDGDFSVAIAVRFYEVRQKSTKLFYIFKVVSQPSCQIFLTPVFLITNTLKTPPSDRLLLCDL